MLQRFLAVIRPHAAEQICMDLLAAHCVTDLEAVECQGSGTRALGVIGDGDLLPKVSLSGIIDPDDLDTLITVIRSHAATGRSGDGKIFIYPIHAEC